MKKREWLKVLAVATVLAVLVLLGIPAFGELIMMGGVDAPACLYHRANTLELASPLFVTERLVAGREWRAVSEEVDINCPSFLTVIEVSGLVQPRDCGFPCIVEREFVAQEITGTRWRGIAKSWDLGPFSWGGAAVNDEVTAEGWFQYPDILSFLRLLGLK